METLEYSLQNEVFRQLVCDGTKMMDSKLIDTDVMFHITNGFSIIYDKKPLKRHLLEHPLMFNTYIEAWEWAQIRLEKAMNIVKVRDKEQKLIKVF